MKIEFEIEKFFTAKKKYCYFRTTIEIYNHYNKSLWYYVFDMQPKQSRLSKTN